MIRYTKEQKKFLINNNYMTPSKELARMFNERFGTDITSTNIKTFRNNNHLNSGLTGRFEKGHSPHNKGKKWDDYMSKESQKRAKKTTFKKGNIPKNYRPVGSERITKDGFVEVKIANPNKWELKSRVVYEKYHKTKIPVGYKIIYLDGNRLNLNIENLQLVSSSEEFIMNREKMRYKNANITKSGYLVAKIIDKQIKLKNNRRTR